MKKISILALAVFLAASAGRLSGQSYRTFRDEFEDARSRTGWRLGPLKLLPGLRIANAGYDSNIFYRPREEGAVSDTVAALAPEVKAYWLLGSSVILSVTESPEYDFYLREKGLRTLTNSVVPAARILLLRSVALSGEYHVFNLLRRSTSEFGEPVRNAQEGWAASLFFETPRGTAVGFSGAVDDFRFRNPGVTDPVNDYARTLDRRERSAAFEFYYRVFSDSHVFLTAGARDYAFVDPASAWRNAYSREISGGLRFPLLGRARGTIALGYKTFVPRTAGRKRFSGLVAATDASLREGRFGLNLAYTRDNYFSYFDTAYYFIEDRVRSGLSFYVFPFLRLEAGWQSGAWTYPEPQEVWSGGGPVLIENRRDRNRVWSAGLAVKVAGNAGLGLSYNLYRRRSNAPGFDIDRHFVGATLTYDF
jgi:hypothetical protein